MDVVAVGMVADEEGETGRCGGGNVRKVQVGDHVRCDRLGSEREGEKNDTEYYCCCC